MSEKKPDGIMATFKRRDAEGLPLVLATLLPEATNRSVVHSGTGAEAGSLTTLSQAIEADLPSEWKPNRELLGSRVETLLKTCNARIKGRSTYQKDSYYFDEVEYHEVSRRGVMSILFGRQPNGRNLIQIRVCETAD
ncbi:MAG: hypothetical protein COV48_05720 [Elusimicrobia bacterium CG11_big_fil_rev_8_21_14_0_20_64_6]|nr:MAG: hypothetical protein COV48_05720 [Elusimicrobia bacterium CG11_big_fil_rev_8_21_14_0_20_64_6]